MSPPRLRLHLLGDFRLTLDDRAVTSVNSPRLQSLLAYLLLHRDSHQARSQIAFTFWPDIPEAHAHNNFRQLLFDLRHALPHAEKFLDAENSSLQWRADAPFALDVDEFESALAAADSERAVALYRGDLLPNCYDDWI
ncbi:MAG: 6-hydroxy-D-nicotine oxidase, partial [Chloroflexota bacterium]|nr:6-hydroxy-D-nicotine oxidase [Chloroflexota bacterium]